MGNIIDLFLRRIKVSCKNIVSINFFIEVEIVVGLFISFTYFKR